MHEDRRRGRDGERGSPIVIPSWLIHVAECQGLPFHRKQVILFYNQSSHIQKRIFKNLQAADPSKVV